MAVWTPNILPIVSRREALALEGKHYAGGDEGIADWVAPALPGLGEGDVVGDGDVDVQPELSQVVPPGAEPAPPPLL